MMKFLVLYVTIVIISFVVVDAVPPREQSQAAREAGRNLLTSLDDNTAATRVEETSLETNDASPPEIPRTLLTTYTRTKDMTTTKMELPTDIDETAKKRVIDKFHLMLPKSPAETENSVANREANIIQKILKTTDGTVQVRQPALWVPPENLTAWMQRGGSSSGSSTNQDSREESRFGSSSGASARVFRQDPARMSAHGFKHIKTRSMPTGLLDSHTFELPEKLLNYRNPNHDLRGETTDPGPPGKYSEFPQQQAKSQSAPDENTNNTDTNTSEQDEHHSKMNYIDSSKQADFRDTNELLPEVPSVCEVPDSREGPSMARIGTSAPTGPTPLREYSNRIVVESGTPQHDDPNSYNENLCRAGMAPPFSIDSVFSEAPQYNLLQVDSADGRHKFPPHGGMPRLEEGSDGPACGGTECSLVGERCVMM